MVLRVYAVVVVCRCCIDYNHGDFREHRLLELLDYFSASFWRPFGGNFLADLATLAVADRPEFLRYQGKQRRRIDEVYISLL